MTTEIKQLNAVAVSQVTKLAAEVGVGDNGDNAKSVPVKILARTNDPIYIEELDVWMVHDFDTMRNKPRLPLDYAHDQYQSIGYLNKVELKDYTLTCSGAIVPYANGAYRDIGHEVVFKMKAGVPYEASIQTDMGDISYVDDGSLVTLNGRNYEGFSPLYVMSNFELLAVAVCKHGRDGNTATELLNSRLSQAKPLEVKITKRETLMSDETKPAVDAPVETPVAEAPAVVDPVVEAPQVEAPVAKKTEAVEAEPVVEVPEVVVSQNVEGFSLKENSAVPAADPASVAKQYMTLFGATDGMNYLASGLSIEDAKTKHLTVLSAENTDLKNRLAAVDRGADTPVKFTPAPRNDAKSEKKGLASLVSVGKPRQ